MFVGTLELLSVTLKVHVPLATGVTVNDCEPFASEPADATVAIVTLPEEMHDDDGGRRMLFVAPLSLAVTV
jgi:hypothetical protein